MQSSMKPIAILGAGSWGSALALHLAAQNIPVNLWSFEAEEILTLQKERINQRYLPNHIFPAAIHPCLDLEEAIKDIAYLVMAIPSIGYDDVLKSINGILPKKIGVVCATKGLNNKTGDLLHLTTANILGTEHPFAVLSGPSFAKEVAAKVPTALVIASEDNAFAHSLKKIFESPIFRIDISDDVTGVEIAGVIKNVIAITTGIADGLKLGRNTRSAVLARGFQEMINLGTALGGKISSFTGLAGVGDLLLTATDDLSRNRRFGLSIGEGKSPEDIEKSIGQAIEGKHNAQQLLQLAKKYSVSIPVCELTWKIINSEISPYDGILTILGLHS